MKQDNQKKDKHLFMFILICFLLSLMCFTASIIGFYESYHTIDLSVNMMDVSDTFDCDYDKDVCKDWDEWYVYGVDNIKKFFVMGITSSFLCGYFLVLLMAVSSDSDKKNEKIHG